jgi:hypothetical protein
MPKIRLIVAAFVAALVLSALTSEGASASTPGWMVDGTQLSGSKALRSTGGISALELKSAAANVAISCTANTYGISNGEIVAPSTLRASSISFLECSAVTPDCTLQGDTLNTVPVSSSEITLEGTSAVRGLLKPQTKSVFLTFEFTGDDCSSEGLNEATGSINLLAREGQTEKTSQLLLGSVASGQLKIDSSEAELEFSYKQLLASNETWSFL